jgi:hypothetical protein
MGGLASRLHIRQRMNLSPRLRASLLSASLVALAGCTGSGGLTTTPGEIALVEGATTFELTSVGGGLPMQRPQGACNPTIWSYFVHIDTSQFGWNRCDVRAPGTELGDYTAAVGTRDLSPAELDAAVASARMVRVSSSTNCGADKPVLRFSVRKRLDYITYGDDFYACQKLQEAYVDGYALDVLHSVLHPLVTVGSP